MSKMLRLTVVVGALLTAQLGWSEARAGLRGGETCGVAATPCPTGTACTYSWVYTCTTTGPGGVPPVNLYGVCVTGFSACLFSTNACPGTLLTGGTCSCYGSDLGANAC